MAKSGHQNLPVTERYARPGSEAAFATASGRLDIAF